MPPAISTKNCSLNILCIFSCFRCPVQLNNVALQPARKEGEKDVMFTHQSKWSCLTSLDYPYNPTITATIQDQTVTQVLQMDMEYQRVNITAKCIQLESEGHNILQDGTFLEKTTYTIADTTGVVELTVWGPQHNMNIDSWFYMTNLSRVFQGKKFLSTTKDITFSTIACTDTTHPIEVTTSEHITANIIGAKVNITYICPLKHQIKDMALSCSRVLCNNCDIFYKSDVIILHTHAKLTIQTTDNIKTLNIENKVIRSVVQISKTATTDTIMDSLLDLPRMQITIHNNSITHLAYPEPSHPETTPLITFSPLAQSTSLSTSGDSEELDLFMADGPTDIQPKSDTPSA
ncbi:uncharacterized protein LOC131538779 [Onychostoma macrolepis]|uniref:uncharacterized protein LOC131538779 n=1 Tax=Onychostoma macrolepis TaxID=369639 RepID=UPI00272A438C|nr:uncharacterized protein LOC131538779 [Onychostoma macrolepis]